MLSDPSVILNYDTPVSVTEAIITWHLKPPHYVKHLCSSFCIHEMVIEVKHGIIHAKRSIPTKAIFILIWSQFCSPRSVVMHKEVNAYY